MHHRPHVRRGTVTIVLCILIAVVVTALVSTLDFVAGESSQRVSALSKVDQAFFAAEAGAQRVEWYCKHGQLASITSPLTGTINGNSYSVTWSTVSGNTIAISAVGTASGGVSSYAISQRVTPPAASVPAMCAGGNNGNISGTVTVNGDLQVVKSINSASHLTVTGNLTMGAALNGTPVVGGDLKVNGDCNGNTHVTGNMTITGNLNSSPVVGKNLAVNGSIWGTPTVTGTTTAHASNTVSVAAPPAVSTMVTALAATAGTTLNNPSSITTLNFSASPNGVIYVHGDANISSINIIGSGTLVISGNLNLSTRFPASGTANVNIVCANDLNISGGLYITGGLYAGNNWNQSAGFAVTGPVVVDADENVSGSGTITAATPPSFDSRASGSSSTTTVTSFTGPMP